MSKDQKNTIKALEEMIQIVLISIPREIQAYEFYMSAVNKATSDSSKELFESLAQQEKGHEAELKRILNELKKELIEIKKS